MLDDALIDLVDPGLREHFARVTSHPPSALTWDDVFPWFDRVAAERVAVLRRSVGAAGSEPVPRPLLRAVPAPRSGAPAPARPHGPTRAAYRPLQVPSELDQAAARRALQRHGFVDMGRKGKQR